MPVTGITMVIVITRVSTIQNTVHPDMENMVTDTSIGRSITMDIVIAIIVFTSVM
jgi:hypothetical protein